MPKPKKEILKNLKDLSKLKQPTAKTPPSELRKQLVGEVYILLGNSKIGPYVVDSVVKIDGKYRTYYKVWLCGLQGRVNKEFVVLRSLKGALARLREPTQAEVALFNAKRPERLLEALEWI